MIIEINFVIDGISKYLGSGLLKMKLRNDDFYYKYDVIFEVVYIGVKDLGGNIKEFYFKLDFSYK